MVFSRWAGACLRARTTVNYTDAEDKSSGDGWRVQKLFCVRHRGVRFGHHSAALRSRLNFICAEFSAVAACLLDCCHAT